MLSICRVQRLPEVLVAPQVPVDPPRTEDALADALARVHRRHGMAALHRGSDPIASAVRPTGVPGLDGIVGCGGFPLGRLAVLAGEGRGATGRLTLLQALTATASREVPVAYVDLAGTLDPGFLADLGADLDACLVLRPEGGRLSTGLAMARSLVRAGVPWLALALPRRLRWETGNAADHALTALIGAVEGARAVACVAACAPLWTPLAYASSLTLGCRSQGWAEAHGDVAGLRLHIDVRKSKVGPAGAEGGLLLRYPRPWAQAEVLGLPALVPGTGMQDSDEGHLGLGLFATARAAGITTESRRAAVP